MPPLVLKDRPPSYSGFWPAWIIYFRVAFLWLLLSVCYTSLRLPLIASPAIPLSGILEVVKTGAFHAAGKTVTQWILPWITNTVSGTPEREPAEILMPSLVTSDLRFLKVVKPNFFCRGACVQLLKSQAELEACLASNPARAELLFQ